MRDSVLLIITILAANLAFGEALPWSQFRERVADAVGQGRHEALVELHEERAEQPAEPPEWNAYWRAYLDYRIAYLGDGEEPDKKRLKACAEQAEAAIEQGEDSGESHALLGLCYGQLAGGGMLAGMRYGSKAQSSLDEALLIAPDNPRVLLAAGVNDLYTPTQYGGDIERAERRLKKAREQLAAGSAADGEGWQPRWGALDVHGHLATALARLDRPDEAIEVLDQAAEAGLEAPWLSSMRERIAAASR